ncbi:hypothetical protein VM57_16845 [Stenotrophomonas maltophilia]|uniref:Uncharacterized protein n=1 Tax=Stenotrophomonas maltophilia TaxID=40324 RepID=A0A0F5ZNM7_STEMA|nr:hypothetical protein VM57_16845 [Stenotrophomonas maltophilia]
MNLVLHCATRWQRIVLNAPQPLSPVQQRLQREPMLTPCKRLLHAAFVATQQRKCHELVDIVVSAVTDSAPIAALEPWGRPHLQQEPA